MRNIPTLAKRELNSFFLSPIAYLVLAGMLAISALNFWDLVQQLSTLRLDAELAGEAGPMVRYVAWNLWFWLALLIVVPIATMRLISEEKRSGTIEVLMTAPVTDTEVVLAKYLAAVVFFCALWVPSFIFLLVLRRYAEYQFDWMPVFGVYLGVLTVGMMFLSVGLFFSSLTRNQIIAAMLTFAVILFLFATFVMEFYAEDRSPALAAFFQYMAVLLHLGEFGAGRLDLGYLVFHLSAVVLMLFLTVKVVEARKWR